MQKTEEANCTLADFLNQLILGKPCFIECFKKNTTVETFDRIFQKIEQGSNKRPVSVDLQRSNHQVEAEEPSSKKKKRKRNRSSKLSKEKKRLREADKLRGKIENATK